MPMTRDETEYWANQLIEQRRTVLKSFRETASKWQSSIAGLLGVFGTAAVIKGPGTFKDFGSLSDEDALQLVLLIAAAAVVAFLALAVSARAAQGMPSIGRHWTPEMLAAWTYNEARATLRWLFAGRLFTFIAATWLFIASVLVPVAYIAYTPPASVRALVIRADGTALCGKLVNPAAVKLEVTGTTGGPTPLRSDDLVTIVERCPPKQ